MEKQHEKRCIGLDLDGTTAFYEKFIAPDNIGKPIPEMVRKVKEALDQGAEVVIFTARVNPGQGSGKDVMDATLAFLAIAEFCRKTFGQLLGITHEKSRHFTEIWDDRGRQVIPNTGVFVQELMEAHGAHR